MPTEKQENTQENSSDKSSIPLSFEKPEKTDLEKIESKLNSALSKIEKFIKEQEIKLNLKDKKIESPEVKELSRLVALQVQALNQTLTPNERNALKTSDKYKGSIDIAMIVLTNELPMTYGWKIDYVNGVDTIVPDGSVG